MQPLVSPMSERWALELADGPGALICICDDARDRCPINLLPQGRPCRQVLAFFKQLLSKGEHLARGVLARTNAYKKLALRAGQRDCALRDDLLALIKQSQGVHRGFHVVAVFLLNLGTLTFFPSSLLSRHSLELVVSEAQKLLAQFLARNASLFATMCLHTPFPITPSANRKCRAVGLPLHARPAHFLREYRVTSTSFGPLRRSSPAVDQTKCGSESSPKTISGGSTYTP